MSLREFAISTTKLAAEAEGGIAGTTVGQAHLIQTDLVSAARRHCAGAM
jgi:hypothetical protein